MPSAPRARNLETLGEFVRSRRALLLPHEVGFVPAPRRKAEGLRRQEVAELAGISLDWYTRIELGKAEAPSGATLTAIAHALRLNASDTRYLFELAGLTSASPHMPPEALSRSVHYIVENVRDAAVVLLDRYVTPQSWNAIADAIFRWSRQPDAFHRNLLVAGFSDPYYRTVLGDDFDSVARRVIGAFRRAYTTSDPTPLAKRIFETGMKDQFFRMIWNENTVAESYTGPEPLIRYVPGLGALCVDSVDLVQPSSPGIFMRMLTPHDESTREKFSRLTAMGTPRAYEHDAEGSARPALPSR